MAQELQIRTPKACALFSSRDYEESLEIMSLFANKHRSSNRIGPLKIPGVSFCGMFYCVKNISALAGSTKHSGLYLSFSSFYCSHASIHHNRSSLISQCSLVLLLPGVNALTTYVGPQT